MVPPSCVLLCHPRGVLCYCCMCWFMVAPLMLSDARCLDASSGWCLVSEASLHQFVWTRWDVQVAFFIDFRALI